jgi:hypothetical protein
MDQETRQALVDLRDYLGVVISALEGLPQTTEIQGVIVRPPMPPIVGSGCDIAKGACTGFVGDPGTGPNLGHVTQLTRNIRDRLAGLTNPPPIA